MIIVSVNPVVLSQRNFFTEPTAGPLFLTNAIVGTLTPPAGGTSITTQLESCVTTCSPGFELPQLTGTASAPSGPSVPFGPFTSTPLGVPTPSVPYTLTETLTITLLPNTTVQETADTRLLAPATTPLPAALPLFASGLGGRLAQEA